MWLCLRRFPTLGLPKGILKSPCLLILLIYTKHKSIKKNLGLAARLHFLKGELIRLVGKTKNVWLIVVQCPIKARYPLIYFFDLHTTIQQKYMAISHFHLLFYSYTTIWRKYMIHFHLFFLFAQSFDKKLRCTLIYYFFYLYTNIRPKIKSSLIYLFFICTRPFDQIIWSSFIYFFFCARPFNLKLGSSLIYLPHLHTTIWQIYMIFFRFFFLCAWPFDKN